MLSDNERRLLQKIARSLTNPYRLVRRVQLVLVADSGANNTRISQQLQLDRGQVPLGLK
jgi:hypothetical protein